MRQVCILRFNHSPQTGDPACICSLCREAFTEEEMPIMLFGGIDAPEEESWEMRYHPDCFIQVFELSDGSFKKRADVRMELEWGD